EPEYFFGIRESSSVHKSMCGNQVFGLIRCKIGDNLRFGLKDERVYQWVTGRPGLILNATGWSAYCVTRESEAIDGFNLGHFQKGRYCGRYLPWSGRFRGRNGRIEAGGPRLTKRNQASRPESRMDRLH